MIKMFEITVGAVSISLTSILLFIIALMNRKKRNEFIALIEELGLKATKTVKGRVKKQLKLLKDWIKLLKIDLCETFQIIMKSDDSNKQISVFLKQVNDVMDEYTQNNRKTREFD